MDKTGSRTLAHYLQRRSSMASLPIFASISPRLLRALPSVLFFGVLACDSDPDPGIDFDSAKTGIYEVHSDIHKDSCTWSGTSYADSSSRSWQSGVYFDKELRAADIPTLEGQYGIDAIQRNEYFEDADFTVDYNRDTACGSQSFQYKLVELFDDRAVVRISRDWQVWADCDSEELLRDTFPDASCSMEGEQVMYLQEACGAPCEVLIVEQDFECVCPAPGE